MKFEALFRSARQLLALLPLCLAAWLPTPAAAAGAAPIELTFTHYQERQHPAHRAAVEFARAVYERTQHKVSVTIFSGSTHGSPPDQLEKIHQGKLDMGLPTHGQLDKYDHAVAALYLPFAFDDLDHAHRALDGPAFGWLAARLEKQDFVLLSNWELGFRHFTNNKRPITKPEDVAGMTVRVPPEMQLEATMEAMGGKPTRIGFNVLAKALQEGKVDAQENPIGIIFHNKFYRQHHYISLTQHIYGTMVHVISAKAWAQLTPEQRVIVREESKRAGEHMRKEVREEEELQLFALQTTQTAINRPSPAPFRAAMGPAYKKISDYAGEDNVRMFLGMIDAARKPVAMATVKP